MLAYQYGDGFTNTFWPTRSLIQLSLCGTDCGHWFKFAWKIYACFIAAGFILIIVANQISYGPFRTDTSHFSWRAAPLVRRALQLIDRQCSAIFV